MKFSVKVVSSFVFVLMICSCASAALPSVTMLSTKTCPACAQMEKVLSEIDSKYAGRISTSHIYLEENPDLVRQYNIRYVPTLVFKDEEGQTAAVEVGYRSLDAVLRVFMKSGINY